MMELNIKSVIRDTGLLPTKATFSDGSTVELMVRKKTGNKGYIAAMWHVIDGVYTTMLCDSSGNTADQAKEKLKEAILKK